LVGDAAGERLTSYLIISFESHWHYYSVHWSHVLKWCSPRFDWWTLSCG
jgi:hypothetical protein